MPDDKTARRRAYSLSRQEIEDELFKCPEGVRAEFKEAFPEELERLGEATWGAFQALGAFVVGLAPTKRTALTESFLLLAFNSVLTSSHLLISGFLVAAGNPMRQYGEACAMALLVSHKGIDVFDRYGRDAKQVSVTREFEKLGRKDCQDILAIDNDGWRLFRKITKWYNKFSHADTLPRMSQMVLGQKGMVVIGTAFDKGKRDAYQHELGLRISAAKLLPDWMYRCRVHLKLAEELEG